MSGSYPVPGGTQEYHICHSSGAFALMLGAGTLSGLLGIGSGSVKVLAMDQMMRLPYKVSATSLRVLFSVVILALAVEMIYSGLTGRI